MPRDDNITITMTKTQALALIKVYDIGLRVTEALGLIQNTSTAEQGINIIKQATSRAR